MQVTVIIPFGEPNEDLFKSLASLCAQSLRDFECLLVNDCADRKSLVELTGAIEDDSRFHLVYALAPSGLGACLNLGLLRASGEYLQILAPGDLLEPEALERRVAALRTNGFASVGVLRVPVTLRNGSEAEPKKRYTRDFTSDFIADYPLNYMFKRQPIIELGGFNEYMPANEEFINLLDRLQFHNYNIINLPEMDAYANPAAFPHYEVASQRLYTDSKSKLYDTDFFYANAANDAQYEREYLRLEPGGSEHPLSPAAQARVDLIFLPHKDYHVVTIAAIQKELDRRGIRSLIVDPSILYRDEGNRELFLKNRYPAISLPQLFMGEYAPRAVAVFNDWDPSVTGPAAKAALKAGIMAIGVVEGVQDYDDVDTGRKRYPYKTVSHVITPCRFDMKYFDAKKQHIYEGAIPRIYNLASDAPNHPYNPRGPVIINSNFSYHCALEKRREQWLNDIVGACREQKLDYVVSRHPFDLGDFAKYKVTPKTMYEAINEGSVFVSRFGSGIIEALAMNRPAIYYNPGMEKIDKFNDPLGAYLIAKNPRELAAALNSTQTELDKLKKNWPRFLEEHAGYYAANPKRALTSVADGLAKALASRPAPSLAARKNFIRIFSDFYKIHKS